MVYHISRKWVVAFSKYTTHCYNNVADSNMTRCISAYLKTTFVHRFNLVNGTQNAENLMWKSYNLVLHQILIYVLLLHSHIDKEYMFNPKCTLVDLLGTETTSVALHCL